MKHKKFLGLFVSMGFFLTAFAGVVTASDVRVIKDVKPTMFEKEIVPLVKVGEINPEVGRDQFIFSPYAFVANQSNQLFVFDRMQSKIFKLDPGGKYLNSWSRNGAGPGEFGGKGRGYIVFMTLGADGLIYVNDTRGYKFLAFDQSGKFIRQVKYSALTFSVAVDSKGNLVFFDTANEILKVFNEKQEVLFTYPMSKTKIEYLLKNTSSGYKRPGRFKLTGGELNLRMTSDDTLLLYFSNSAKLWVVKNKKLIREIKVWPKDALDRLKSKIGTARSVALFYPNWFLDSDEKDVVYFQFMEGKPKPVNRLYKVSLDGKLKSVLSTDVKEDSGYPKFHVKINDRYYARLDDKIIIYEEARK